jgi:hypothetical protein
MASEVEICKMALSHIRAGSINSLTESSVQAQQCKLFYPLVRDQMLRDLAPPFAKRVRALAERSGDDIFNWAYSYQYPSDCLKVLKLRPNYEEVQQGEPTIYSRYRDPNYPIPDLSSPVNYEIQNIDNNRVILTNEQQVRADIIIRVEDPNLFDIQHIFALSYLLASELSLPLVGVEKGRALRGDNLQIYNQYVATASAEQLNEEHSDVPDSEFITVRG